MQGDTHAGEQLLEQYHPTLDNSVQPMDLQFPSSPLSALDPISGCNVSVSISTYADDLARATVCTSPDDVQAQLEAANVSYARVPGTIRVSQMLKNKSMFHVLSAGMPTITHAKILKKDRLPGKTCAACKKATEQGVTVHNALPNKEVWRWLRLVPSSIELCIRRLRYWQNVAKFRNYHKAILATVFGKFSFDRDDLLDSDGRVVVWHPLLRQFRDDLEMLGGLDSGQSLLDRF